jgi:hypothetical protein
MSEKKQYRCPSCGKIFTYDHIMTEWCLVAVPIDPFIGRNLVCAYCLKKQCGYALSKLILIEVIE